MTRKRILFMAEAATLAHIARPLQLSTTLDRDQFEVFFACDPRCLWLLRDQPLHHLPLSSISSQQFLSALARGTPLYSAATLREYVRSDLKLFQAVKPDIVVGDFRLSLSVSARLAKVPYVTISNCYWSPHWQPARYPVPNLPLLTGALPISVASALFQSTRRIAFALHCLPLNRVRQEHGLPSLGHDLRRVYTDADHVLYTDIPRLYPNVQLPSHHHFIGPLVWSPPVPFPGWWNTLPPEKPIVYVTLGSSGQGSLLNKILENLKDHDIVVIAATAGNKIPNTVPANARVADYLPGEHAARRSRLVICNGGSPTSQQALAAGVPVIGISSNLDQFLNMDTLVRAGVGENMRCDRFDGALLARWVTRMLNASAYTLAAKGIAEDIARNDYATRFSSVIQGTLIAPA